MTQDPTPYDLLQDAEISGLQDIVSPYYQPREGVEHSFPVVGQGINAEEYRLMSLAQGDGIIVTGQGDRSHTLTNFPGGASETNAQNQMILRVAQNTGRGEAILGGYYHVFYEDMRLSFPPVTTPTTYHVCITRDPRKEEDPGGPLFVEVYAGTPPTTHNRAHIILHTVHREPNQVLTDATRKSYRQIVSPVITVSAVDRLPDSTTLAHQTLGIVRNQAVGGSVGEGTGQLFEARGVSGWQNLLVGPWQQVSLGWGWNHIPSYPVQSRLTVLGVQMRGRADGSDAVSDTSIGDLPEGHAPTRELELNPVIGPPHARDQFLRVLPSGRLQMGRSRSERGGTSVTFDGIIFPHTH